MYKKLREQYRSEGLGIYDDSTDLDRAIILSDAYHGDESGVVQLCQMVEKPVIIQDLKILEY